MIGRRNRQDWEGGTDGGIIRVDTLTGKIKYFVTVTREKILNHNANFPSVTPKMHFMKLSRILLMYIESLEASLINSYLYNLNINKSNQIIWFILNYYSRHLYGLVSTFRIVYSKCEVRSLSWHSTLYSQKFGIT